MAQKAFTVTEPGVADAVINDLGAITIGQNTTVNLFPSNYTMEQIRDSVDLKAAIEAGELTALFGTTSITSAALFEATVFDYNKEEINAVEGEQSVEHQVGTAQATINQDLERLKDGTTTAETPFIAPFTTSYLRIAVIKSKNNDIETYDIKVLVNDTSVKTFSVTAGTGIIDAAVTGISANVGDSIRYRIEQNGVTTFDVRKLECTFNWSSKAS